MLTWRVGVASSPAAGKAMAEYLSTELLRPEKEELARYYAGELVPAPVREQIEADRVGREQNRESRAFREAVGLLAAAERAAGRGGEIETDLVMDERVSNEFIQGPAGVDGAESARTIGRVRPDLSPAFAARLGIRDPRAPLTVAGLASLLNGQKVDGRDIQGRHRKSASLSVAEVFGLDPKAPPSGEAVRNILTGRRADGGTPRNDKGEDLTAARVQGARVRFLQAIGVPTHREPNAAEIDNLLAGKLAAGGRINLGEYRRQMTATRARVAYIDFTFSADKSFSVAWALAPTEGERALIHQITKDAAAAAMNHAEYLLGEARIGRDGKGGSERGELAWIGFDHYTSRPTVDIARTDSEGRAYTEMRDVPLRTADPNIHFHMVALNSVFTESGRIGSIDLDRLEGAVKEIGAVFQAYVARFAREHGIDVVLDERTGAARLTAVPPEVRDFFSKRAAESQRAAERFAEERGLDWNTLTPERQSALLRAGAAEMRQAKDKRERDDGMVSDFATWCREARDALGYEHRGVVRPNGTTPELAPEQRITRAYEVTQRLIEQEFSRRAKIDSGELREIAARGLIAAGIQNPARDIAAVTRAYREYGVRQDGQAAALVWGRDVPLRGKARWSITTDLHEAQETELIALARKAAADRSAALPAEQIERAASAFLDRMPAIDRAGAQWAAQRAMMDALGTGGRLVVGIGAAGAGKSTVLQPLAEAWRAEGRTVYATALAWRQASELARGMNISPDATAAMDPFLRRVARGKYQLDRNSVVVVDELALIGKRQLLELLRVQEKHGFAIRAIGDNKQCQSIEAGPVIELLRQALGAEAIPEITTGIRQKAERERAITAMIRDGRLTEAIEMKREDGTVELVAGGSKATAARVIDLWEQRVRTQGIQQALILAPTNEDVREIGLAARDRLQRIGMLGANEVTLPAIDRNSGATYELALAPGDRLRLFDRVHDAETGGRAKVLASNGDVVTVLALTQTGMRVRNDQGQEGTVAWAKISDGKPAPDRSPGEGPLRLAYGYAGTIDSKQGATARDPIAALLHGSRPLAHGKAYTALSRHTHSVTLVVDEAAERRDIARRIPLGKPVRIKEQDIWRNVAANLMRQTEKGTALGLIARATDLRRANLRGLQVAGAREERWEAAGISQARARVARQAHRLGLSRVVEKAAAAARGLSAVIAERARQITHSGRNRGHDVGR